MSDASRSDGTQQSTVNKTVGVQGGTYENRLQTEEVIQRQRCSKIEAFAQVLKLVVVDRREVEEGLQIDGFMDARLGTCDETTLAR